MCSSLGGKVVTAIHVFIRLCMSMLLQCQCVAACKKFPLRQ